MSGTRKPAARHTVTGVIAGMITATAAATGVGFWLSYAGLHDFATRAGSITGAEGWAWPASVDLFIAAGEAGVTVSALRGEKDKIAWAYLIAGFTTSVTANILHVFPHLPHWARYAVAAVPPVAAMAALAAVLRQLYHRAVAEQDTPALVPLAAPGTAPAAEPAPAGNDSGSAWRILFSGRSRSPEPAPEPATGTTPGPAPGATAPSPGTTPAPSPKPVPGTAPTPETTPTPGSRPAPRPGAGNPDHPARPARIRMPEPVNHKAVLDAEELLRLAGDKRAEFLALNPHVTEISQKRFATLLQMRQENAAPFLAQLQAKDAAHEADMAVTR